MIPGQSKIDLCLWEGLIYDWKHTLLALPLPFMPVKTSWLDTFLWDLGLPN